MRSFSVAIILGLLSATVLAQADLSSPKAAFKSYTEALAAGNLDALKAASISTDKQSKMLAGMSSYSLTEKKFRDAVIKAFPDAAKELPDPSAETLKSIESATVKTEGDSAVLITNQSVEPVKLKRDAGKWKVDIASMYNDDSVNDLILFRNALADIMTEMTTDIEAGKYKSYSDIKNTLEMRVKMRIAMPPDESPTTKPGN